MNNMYLYVAMEAVADIIAIIAALAIIVYWVTFFISLLVLIISAIKYFCSRQKTICKDCPYRRYYNEVYNKPKNSDYEPFQ